MTRSPRPSQVHRLPAPNGEPPPPQAPQRRGRRGPLLVVGTAAAALLLLAMLTDTGPRPPQLVPLDITSEDEAVAALGLFAAQDAATAAIGPQILGQPGPQEMARKARTGAESAAVALRHARSQPASGGLAAAYWSSPGHDWLVGELRNLADLADDIGLLAAVHDTLYGGAGLIAADEAEHALVNRFRAGRPPATALAGWSDLLLAELDGHDATAPATQARRATEQHWAQAAARARPPDVDRLRDYVASLHPALLEGLRGHPVAGPALDRLRR